MGADDFQSSQPLNVEELKAFMGIMILMGITNLPSLYDYWENDLETHQLTVPRGQQISSLY